MIDAYFHMGVFVAYFSNNEKDKLELIKIRSDLHAGAKARIARVE